MTEAMGIFGGSGVEEAAAAVTAVSSAEASAVAEAGLGFDMLGKVSKPILLHPLLFLLLLRLEKSPRKG